MAFWPRYANGHATRSLILFHCESMAQKDYFFLVFVFFAYLSLVIPISHPDRLIFIIKFTIFI
ncbi:hypothetical protein [Moorena producens]|uniref:hypothetical protein n=1 Tax=Moorena producens TaxID=1155739 RepID=UPI0011EA6585|nr:hypothetical protein [Moorena producens]